MNAVLRNALLSVCLLVGTLCAPPARAFDPITMLLFSMARELMFEAFANSQKPHAPRVEPLPAFYPGTMVEPRKLRALIDESFYYLSERRRTALFDAFHDELIKPKNATVRAAMIQYFAERAYAVRNVMERLSKLTEPEMRELSEHFAAEMRNLPVAEREQLRKVLEEGLLPVPPDLNRMLVVAAAEIPRPRAELAAAKRDGDVGKARPEAIAVEKDGGAGRAASERTPQGHGGPNATNATNAQIAVDDAVVVRPEDAPPAVERPASDARAAPPSEATAVAPRTRQRPESPAVW